jgi:hypothetical protein
MWQFIYFRPRVSKCIRQSLHSQLTLQLRPNVNAASRPQATERYHEIFPSICRPLTLSFWSHYYPPIYLSVSCKQTLLSRVLLKTYAEMYKFHGFQIVPPCQYKRPDVSNKVCRYAYCELLAYFRLLRSKCFNDIYLEDSVLLWNYAVQIHKYNIPEDFDFRNTAVGTSILARLN